MKPKIRTISIMALLTIVLIIIVIALLTLPKKTVNLPAQSALSMYSFGSGVSSIENYHEHKESIAVHNPQLFEIDESLTLIRKDMPLAKQLEKDPDARVMPLIKNKGFATSIATDFLENKTAQTAIISQLVTIALANNYIGYQVDFENISRHNKTDFTLFVRDFDRALKVYDLEISVAVRVPTRTRDEAHLAAWNPYDYEALARYSDYLVLMAYDDQQSLGPTGSVDFTEKALKNILTFAESSKISLAVPLYCSKWSKHSNEFIKALTYPQTQRDYEVSSDKSTAIDNETGASVYHYTSNEDNLSYRVYCDNEDTYRAKFNLAETYNLHSVSAWALGQESDDFWKAFKESQN